jgi:cytochrome P450 family 109
MNPYEDAYNPFLWYKKMRNEEPVFYDEQTKLWNVFLYDDVKKILDDKENYSNAVSMAPIVTGSFIESDPPKYTDHRSLVSKALYPKGLAHWRRRIEAVTNELFSQIQDKHQVDLIQTITYPLPVIVIAEILGIPREDQDKFRKWSDVLVIQPQNEEEAKFKKDAEDGIYEYFQYIIHEKRQNPQDDIISLVNAEVDGERLSEHDLVVFCIMLLVAGNGTIANVIGNAFYTFLEQPEIYQALRENPYSVYTVVEETLRYRPSVHRQHCLAKKDMIIRGKKINQGQLVVAWIGSANRDENIFTNPDTFQLNRDFARIPHLAFGHGRYYWLGSYLANLVIRNTCTKLLQTYKNLTFPSDFVLQPIENSFVIGLRKLDVILH